MRVIAGSRRHLILKSVPGLSVRPTTDRTKETLFNMLTPYLADCSFLDLFSGSGAIGIEALSRGALIAVMVEQSQASLDCIKENLKTVDNILEKYNINYDISYGNNYFPKKIYKGVTYPEGKYQSLVITLGEGKGDNWWCVLFPPLCLIEAEESEENIEYSSFFKTIFDKIIHR